MRTIKKSEFSEWCQQRGLESGEREWPRYLEAKQHSFLVKIPGGPAYRTVVLARSCFPFEENVSFHGAMVWIREWGIWSEIDEQTGMQAVDRMRAALGETRPLIEAPGHSFTPEEYSDARAFWTLPMIFGWDAILFPEQSDYFVFSSHDEVVCFVSRTVETHSRLLEAFKEWQPEDNGWYFH